LGDQIIDEYEQMAENRDGRPIRESEFAKESDIRFRFRKMVEDLKKGKPATRPALRAGTGDPFSLVGVAGLEPATFRTPCERASLCATPRRLNSIC
jgi:hypothetical protein